MFYSQLCALATTDEPMPSLAEIVGQYHVLPSENPISAFLASLALEMGVEPAVVQRIHEGLESECNYGSQLSIPAYPTWRNATESRYPNLINGSDLRGLLLHEANFSSRWAAAAGTLHMQSTARSEALIEQYYALMNFSANHTPCWGVAFAPAPNRTIDTDALPHSQRWTLFDNSNYRFSNVRLDICLPGLPHAVNVSSNIDSTAPAQSASVAADLLSEWVQEARSQQPQCFNTTGYNVDLAQPHTGDALVSDAFKIAFETSAKSASMSATRYLQCRFDAQPNRTASEDYTRLMILRNPTSRAVSAFLEMAMHYIAIVRLPPAALRTCADAWPEGIDSIHDDHSLWTDNNTWPPICVDAFTHNPYTKQNLIEAYGDEATARNNMLNINEENARSTADSALLNALWELPPGCRQLGRTLAWGVENNASYSVTWWCDEPECYQPCAPLDDDTMAALLAHALSDAARANLIGCGPQLFGGEHMWPQSLHIARAGRADVVLRLEHIEEDNERFDRYLEKQLGRALPPASVNCTLTSVHENNGTVLEPALSNATQVLDLIDRHPELQR